MKSIQTATFLNKCPSALSVVTGILVSCTLLFAALNASAQIAPNTEVPETLIPKGSDLQTTYLRPQTDLRKYNQFILVPLNLSHTRIVPPPWKEDEDPRKWQLSEINANFLRAVYKTEFKKGLEESGKFNVVENAVPGTLELEVSLISLEPYADAGEKVKTKGYGELSFEASLRDANTGELLAMFEGTQQVGKEYQENTVFNKGHNFAEHFLTWGRNVSRRMTAIHAM